MGGVDKNDTMFGNHSRIQKTYKLTTAVFFHYLEEAIFNSLLLYSESNGKKVDGMQGIGSMANVKQQ